MADKFQFYSGSKDAKPGSGVGEHVNNPNDYLELAKFPHWRRMLSSLYDQINFVYHDYTYRSFEHAFQSEKFRINGYTDLAYRFTLESNDEIGRGSGLTARSNRKLRMLSDQELQRWNEQRHQIKIEIYKAKFSLEPLKSILLATGPAVLYHSGPRIPKIRCVSTEVARDWLRDNQ